MTGVTARGGVGRDNGSVGGWDWGEVSSNSGFSFRLSGSRLWAFDVREEDRKVDGVAIGESGIGEGGIGGVGIGEVGIGRVAIWEGGTAEVGMVGR
jgi:hypothetical protein